MGLRILLVDRREIFVEGLRALLTDQPGLEVLSHAGEGREAVRIARRKAPDLVLIGISVPGVNGIEVTRQIINELPDTKVICLTAHSNT